MAEKGLTKVEQIYNDKGSLAKERIKKGEKIFGYFCTFAPVELLTAAGVIPYRITGKVSETIKEADAYIETIMCPYVRNCFDQAIKGGDYSFLDGFIVPHACDNIVKIYDIWKYNLKPKYTHFLNMPHCTNDASLEFLSSELNMFKKSLEKHTGKEITNDKLNEAIKLHNDQRALVKELYDLRKQDPPLITGTEVIKVIVSITKIPVQEGNELLKEVIAEIKGRASSPVKKLPRVLVYGPEIDDALFIQMIEETGSNVVIDDICLGTRSFWFNVEETQDPIAGIAKAYLVDINCPRTYRQRTGSRQDDLEARFGYIRKFAEDFKADGIFLYTIMYCDNYEFDAVDIKDYMDKAGFPGFIVEGDYTEMSIQWLKTRVQAFLEMIA
ncbi:MAG: 2-hydroxyacyl-CoA dehydratase family protein [Spirochaetota bacterium]|nr:2-hydroxyacyl-CoA dehydratase family protein [Spirochaetota bacterium]